MIVIYGFMNNDDKLASRLKKYFEAEVLVPNWNGSDVIEDIKTTLLLTKRKPKLNTLPNVLSLDSAIRIMEL